MKPASAASFWPPAVKPNSDACLIELMVSPPAFASAMTFAFDACAVSKGDAKSAVPTGIENYRANTIF